MAEYTLISKDPVTGCEAVMSILAHLPHYGITLQSVHYEAGTWTIVTDKDISEKERAHFEDVSRQTTLTRASR